MTKIKSVTCPNCGAVLTVDEGIDSFFCTYCGTKLHFSSEEKHVKVEKEIRYIDEARIKEVELKIKELEDEKATRESLTFGNLIKWILIMLSIPVLGALMMKVLQFINLS